MPPMTAAERAPSRNNGQVETGPSIGPATTLGARPQATPAMAVPALLRADDPWNYVVDAWERSVLFWDVLRRRANNMLEHDEAAQQQLFAGHVA